MTGVLTPTSGRIFVRDREVDLADYSVRMAHDLSIETVYQDKSLGEKQPLWRNFFVGRQITNRCGFIDIRKEKADRRPTSCKGRSASGAPASRSIRRSPSCPAASARASPSAGRCISTPTSSCSTSRRRRWRSKEVRKVLDFVRRIKASGRACIYIEHNLAHVHEVADRLVVIDRGAIVAEIARGT